MFIEVTESEILQITLREGKCAGFQNDMRINLDDLCICSQLHSWVKQQSFEEEKVNTTVIIKKKKSLSKLCLHSN